MAEKTINQNSKIEEHAKNVDFGHGFSNSYNKLKQEISSNEIIDLDFKKYMTENKPFTKEEKEEFNKINDLKKKFEVAKTYFIDKPSYYDLQVTLNKYEIDFLIEILRRLL